MTVPKPPEKLITCDVLRENVMFIFKEFYDIEDSQNLVARYEVTKSLGKEENRIKLYDDILDDIANDFSIPIDKKDDLKKLLEKISTSYLILALMPHSNLFFDGYMDQLYEITKAAEKLRNILNSAGDDFADFISYMYIQENGISKAPRTRYFFHNLVECLNALISTPDELRQTMLGKTFKLGAKGRKRNESLYAWITHLYKFWGDDLSRTMKRDTSNIGGRKKFLEFLDACIEPLHPEIMSNNSDALDTTLKVIQKDIKRGENKPAF